jgi:hypothetical protein
MDQGGMAAVLNIDSNKLISPLFPLLVKKKAR